LLQIEAPSSVITEKAMTVMATKSCTDATLTKHLTAAGNVAVSGYEGVDPWIFDQQKLRHFAQD
jgi:hypothetical protein